MVFSEGATAAVVDSHAKSCVVFGEGVTAAVVDSHAHGEYGAAIGVGKFAAVATATGTLGLFQHYGCIQRLLL